MITALRKGYVFLLFAMILLAGGIVVSRVANAAGPFTFEAIEGGAITLEDWRGKPVLVVNTASRCGFTPQYDELQALYDRYASKGLIVLAVPSNDFRQELGSAEAVQEFCEANFNLTLPMTDITHVKGSKAHPFFKWVRESVGFEPAWNFNKILIGPNGDVLGTWGSAVKPLSGKIVDPIEAALGAS
jgi:glutathione peroxidase